MIIACSSEDLCHFRPFRTNGPRMNPPVTPGVDGRASDALLKLGRFFTRWDESEDGRIVFREGGRAGDVFYRDRWSHDKVVRSTHGVNCTGSCSWKIYVRDGIITWRPSRPTIPRLVRIDPSMSLADARAVRPSPGTPTPPPGSDIPTPAASCWRCIGRPSNDSPIPCWPGPTWSPTRSDGAAITRRAARAGSFECPGPKQSR
jgi:hypothetical protein